MTAIMVVHIRSKYTAVGRKEIVLFFYLYALIELLSIFLDSGIIPTSSSVYPVSPARPLGKKFAGQSSDSFRYITRCYAITSHRPK